MEKWTLSDPGGSGVRLIGPRSLRAGSLTTRAGVAQGTSDPSRGWPPRIWRSWGRAYLSMTYGSWLPRVWRSEIRRISIFGVFLSRGQPPGLARRVVGGRGSWSLPGSMLAFVNGVALVAAGGCRSTSDRCTWLYCSRGRAGLRPRGGRYRENDAALRGPQAGCGLGKRRVIYRLSGRGGGVAKALIRRIRSGAAAPWRRAARASCRQVNAPSVWALTSSSKEASLMSTVAMDRWRLVGCRRAGRHGARRWSGGRASRCRHRRTVLEWSGSAGRWRRCRGESP